MRQGVTCMCPTPLCCMHPIERIAIVFTSIRSVLQALVAGWVLMTGAQAMAQDAAKPDVNRFDMSLSTEWSTGHYGEDQPTDLVQSTVSARYRSARWLAELEVPWLEVRSTGAQASLPGSVGSGAAVEQGLGDVWVKLTWEAREFDVDRTGVDVTLKVKSDSGEVDKGLGTGGVDVALQVAAMRSVGAHGVAFGHLGYRRTGDVPGYARYADPWYGELGIQTSQWTPWTLGVYGSARQATGRLGPLKELTVFGSVRTGSQTIQAYLTQGHARASPAWAMGMSARHRF